MDFIIYALQSHWMANVLYIIDAIYWDKCQRSTSQCRRSLPRSCQGYQVCSTVNSAVVEHLCCHSAVMTFQKGSKDLVTTHPHPQFFLRSEILARKLSIKIKINKVSIAPLNIFKPQKCETTRLQDDCLLQCVSFTKNPITRFFFPKSLKDKEHCFSPRLQY